MKPSILKLPSTLLLTICFLHSGLLRGDIHQVQPSDYHVKTMAEDGRIIDLAFDDKKESLWLLGEQALWQWNFVEQRLQRFKLQESGKIGTQLNAERIFAIQGSNHFAVAAGSRLFLVSQDPFKVTEFQLPQATDHDATVNVSLNTEQQCCLWVHTQGVFQVDIRDAKIESIASFSQSNDRRKGAVLWYHQIWSTSDQELFALDLFTGEERSIHRSKDKIRTVHLGQHQDIILVTSQALIRLQANGEIAQIIPQRHQKPLASVHFDSTVHSYLFEDGLLERYHMPFEHLETYDLSKYITDKFDKAVIAGPFVSLIEKDRPSVFIIGAP